MSTIPDLPALAQGEAIFEGEDHPLAADDSILGRSVALRYPVSPARSDGVRRDRQARTAQLEDHIAATAIARGELADLRLRAHVSLRNDTRTWDRLAGWEHHRGKDTTDASVERAKAKHAPDLYGRMKDARWVIERCTEEMQRMDKDYDQASREYSLLSGS